jgi:hypothetical protein
MEDAIIGLEWTVAKTPKEAVKAAKKRIAKQKLKHVVWVLSAAGDKNRCSFALANREQKGKISRAAAFAAVVANGLIVERLESGYYWLAASMNHAVLPGTDRELTLQEAQEMTQSMVAQLQLDGHSVFVPKGFPWYREEEASSLDYLEEAPRNAVSFRDLERGLPGWVWAGVAFWVLVILGLTGWYFWHRQQEEQLLAQERAAQMARMHALLEQKNLKSAKEKALQNAIKQMQVAIGRMRSDWNAGSSVAQVRRAVAFLLQQSPMYGWSWKTAIWKHGSWQLNYSSDILRYPDYVTLAKDLRSQGWRVQHNPKYSSIMAMKSFLVPRSSLLVMQKLTGLPLLLQSIPVNWKKTGDDAYAPLPYQKVQYTLTQDGFPALSRTLQLLSRFPASRVESLQISDTGSWSMVVTFLERSTGHVVHY